MGLLNKLTAFGRGFAFSRADEVGSAEVALLFIGGNDDDQSESDLLDAAVGSRAFVVDYAHLSDGFYVKVTNTAGAAANVGNDWKPESAQWLADNPNALDARIQAYLETSGADAAILTKVKDWVQSTEAGEGTETINAIIQQWMTNNPTALEQKTAVSHDGIGSTNLITLDKSEILAVDYVAYVKEGNNLIAVVPVTFNLDRNTAIIGSIAGDMKDLQFVSYSDGKTNNRILRISGTTVASITLDRVSYLEAA